MGKFSGVHMGCGHSQQDTLFSYGFSSVQAATMQKVCSHDAAGSVEALGPVQPLQYVVSVCAEQGIAICKTCGRGRREASPVRAGEAETEQDRR